jgi:hypothetical protein
MAEIEIIAVPAEALRFVWAKASPLLAEAVAQSHGTFLTEDVLACCERGAMQLWLACEGEDVIAAVAAEIVIFPRKKVLGIPFAGGRDMARWYAKMEAAVEAWAKGFGCTAERLYGRKGWARVTKGQESGVMLWREFAAEPVSAEVH